MNKMFNRNWLIKEVWARYNKVALEKGYLKIYLKEFREIANVVEDIVIEILRDRNGLVLYGLMKFWVKKYPERNLYNFATKKMNIVSGKEKIIIDPSPTLHSILEEEEETEEV